MRREENKENSFLGFEAEELNLAVDTVEAKSERRKR